jgi:hypothetical protein
MLIKLQINKLNKKRRRRRRKIIDDNCKSETAEINKLKKNTNEHIQTLRT